MLSASWSKPLSATEDWMNGGFGLYIHWPFCQAKCPYCDFNSHVVSSIDHQRWTKAYLSEIDRIADETQGRVLNSVFFGGGTPSMMHPDTVAAIIEKLKSRWSCANDLEITLEANPTSVEAGRFQGYRDGGVSRISMGIQSLRDEPLRLLGRLHSVAEAKQAFDIARKTFDRISFDLIYARQYQTADDWKAELSEALAMSVDHLSLYQLTVEDGTAFGTRFAAGKLPGLPSEDLGAELYEITQEFCEQAGMPAYEVSNHASDMAWSRHNLIYWRYGDYAGIGPGAHGRLTLNNQRMATTTPLAPTEWLKRVEDRGNGEDPRELIDAKDQALEALLMGLRLTEGVSICRIETIFKGSLEPSKLEYLGDLGLISIDQDRLQVSPKGRPVLNGVLRELTA